MFYPLLNSRFSILWKIFFCLILPLITIYAEKLPTRIYTIADGLSRDFVYCIAQDSRGFIWFGTAEGLYIYEKLQVHSKSETVAKALQQHLIK